MKRITNLILAMVLWGLGFAASADSDADAGKTLSAQCVACHGADGNSTDPQYPKLAGQYENYIVRALSDYKSGARKNPIMAGFAAGLSEDDIDNLAAYFSSQSGLKTPVLPNIVSD